MTTGVNYLNAKPSAQEFSKERLKVGMYNINMEKTIILSVAVLALIAMTQPAYAFRSQLSDAPSAGQGGTHPNQAAIDTNTGFILGAHDGKDKCNPDCQSWIDLPGNGFANKTQEFIRGYIYGYCTNQENINGAGREDSYNADFDCDKGPSSASWSVQQPAQTFKPTELPAMPQVNNTIVGSGNATNRTS